MQNITNNILNINIMELHNDNDQLC